MIKNKNVKIMGIISSVILLIIVITASFAYFGSFNVNLNNNVAVNVNSVSPGNGTFVSNATQLNLQVPAANMSLTASDNTIAAASNTATLSVSLTSGSTEIETTCTFDIYYEYTGSNFYGVSPSAKTSGTTKEITMTVNAPSGTSNFSTETNFDYNSSTGWTTENNKRKVKLVDNASITNSGTTATTQEYTFTGKYYNLDISQEQLANKSFTGIIYASKKECTSKDIMQTISTFNLESTPYSFEEGMTFNDWSSSKYNLFGYNLNNFDIVNTNGIIWNSKLIESGNDYKVNSKGISKEISIKCGSVVAYFNPLVYNSEVGKYLYENKKEVLNTLYADDIVDSISQYADNATDENDKENAYSIAEQITNYGNLLFHFGPVTIAISDYNNATKTDEGQYVFTITDPNYASNNYVPIILHYDTSVEEFAIYEVYDSDFSNNTYKFNTYDEEGAFVILIFDGQS